jgi:hypothetical protein
MPVYFSALICELCRLSPGTFGPAVGKCFRKLHDMTGEGLDVEISYRFSEWFAVHMSNFEFRWPPWQEWCDQLCNKSVLCLIMTPSGNLTCLYPTNIQGRRSSVGFWTRKFAWLTMIASCAQYPNPSIPKKLASYRNKRQDQSMAIVIQVRVVT